MVQAPVAAKGIDPMQNSSLDGSTCSYIVRQCLKFGTVFEHWYRPTLSRRLSGTGAGARSFAAFGALRGWPQDGKRWFAGISLKRESS